MKELNFKLMGVDVSCLMELSNNEINLELSALSDFKLDFACYLINSSDIEEKAPYNKYGVFNFSIKNTGRYSVKIYLRNIESKERVSRIVDVGYIYRI